MPQDPFDILESVHDEETFIQFLRALAADHAESAAQERVSPSSPFGPTTNGWENITIDSYLHAAAVWAESSTKGLPVAQYTPPSNPWRRCADILYAGKIYE